MAQTPLNSSTEKVTANADRTQVLDPNVWTPLTIPDDTVASSFVPRRWDTTTSKLRGNVLEELILTRVELAVSTGFLDQLLGLITGVSAVFSLAWDVGGTVGIIGQDDRDVVRLAGAAGKARRFTFALPLVVGPTFLAGGAVLKVMSTQRVTITAPSLLIRTL